MSDSIGILHMKIYEVVNGSEVYKWDQDWFVPITDRTSAGYLTPDGYQETILAVTNACGTKPVSFFHGDESSAASFSYGRPIDITPYENKIFMCHIKSNDSHDRALRLNFHRYHWDFSSGNKTTRWEVDCNLYLDGVDKGQVYSSTSLAEDSFGEVGSYGTSYIKHLYSLPFPNADCTILTKYDLYKVAYQIAPDPLYDHYAYNGTTIYESIDSSKRNIWRNWFSGYEPVVVDEDNPYYDGGTSTEGGGGGNFSEDSDDVDVDDIPTIDAVDTGFSTIFTPSKTQLKGLSNVLWNSTFFDFVEKLLTNIEDLFTSLAIVPFNVTAGPTKTVTFLGFTTSVDLTLAALQYYEFDMGSIDMANDSRIYTSKSALDYSPYSTLGIFLPFIGYQDLDIDECRDAVIGLKYRIDILSGTCVALISINGNTIYQFTGNCLSQIPITNENMQSLVSDAIEVGVAAVATKGAMGAASADMAAAEGSSKMNEVAKEAKIAHAQAHVASSAGQLTSATANAAMGMKPHFGKAGAISASASLLAVKQPYLFLTTPRQSIPDKYQKYCGFPSNITGKLNTFSGFTVVEDIRLNGLVATSPEVAEIYELLKKGVII